MDKPFTAQAFCQTHEKAVAFFGGIERTIVYDQDRTMVADENIGNMMLNSTFKQYIKSRSFTLYFCKRANPESKGYIKKNFLYNRLYSDKETLNTKALAWRIANLLPHNFTKKSPKSENIIEKKHLNPYIPLIIENMEKNIDNVRKINTIAYKSNFYNLPIGTYKGVETQAIVKEMNSIIGTYSLQEKLICTDTVSSLKGQTITNTNYKQDTSTRLDEMISQTSSYFPNNELAMSYIKQIRELLSSYTRDHL